jgi:hypothetical protein
VRVRSGLANKTILACLLLLAIVPIAAQQPVAPIREWHLENPGMVEPNSGNNIHD